MTTLHDWWLNRVPEDEELPEGYDSWEELESDRRAQESEEKYERLRGE